MSFFFYLLSYFIVIANIFFQIDRLEPSVTDSVFRFHFRDSVSGFHVLVLPLQQCPALVPVVQNVDSAIR